MDSATGHLGWHLAPTRRRDAPGQLLRFSGAACCGWAPPAAFYGLGTLSFLGNYSLCLIFLSQLPRSRGIFSEPQFRRIITGIVGNDRFDVLVHLVLFSDNLHATRYLLYVIKAEVAGNKEGPRLRGSSDCNILKTNCLLILYFFPRASSLVTAPWKLPQRLIPFPIYF